MEHAGQRYHKHRQGSMVTPGVSGLLFTVDPNQVGKAIRELKLYLDRFQAHLSQSPEVKEDEEQIGSAGSTSAAPADSTFTSISSLLAAELNEFRSNVPSVTSPDGLSVGPQRGKRKNNNERMFGVLETNCKGYLFVNVPRPQGESDGGSASADSESRKRNREEGIDDDCLGSGVVRASAAVGAPEETSSDCLDVSSAPGSTARGPRFPVNPLVARLVDAIFEELAQHPSRPITRFSYRMFPVSTTCFPTAESIAAAVSALCETIPPIPGRYALKVGIQVSVKNNTKMEQQRQAILSAAEKAVASRGKFVVLPVGRKDITLDGVLCVLVMHSTCCVGYSPKYSERKDYNLHDFGRETETALAKK